MKKTLAKSMALAFVGVLLATGSALAMPVSGQIDLGGMVAPSVVTTTVDPILGTTTRTWAASTLGAANAIDFKSATVQGGTGDFASLEPDFSDPDNPIFRPVAMTDFQFSPDLYPSPVNPLWSVGGFSFVMDSLSVIEHTETSLILAGSGDLIAAGFDTTIGEWRFSTQNTSGNANAVGRFSWSSTQVPEPATMLLLGTGLVGLAGVSRRKSKLA